MDLKGTITAMITPFIEDRIDEEGLASNVHYQIQAGISGLFPLGSTGEASTISAGERERIVKIVVKETNGRVPVFVGTGTYCTQTTIESSKKAEDLGADALVIVTPYYNKPTQEGLFRHYQAIVENTSIPIVVYNIQGRTGINIETATLERLAELPRIIGVKEASGNICQIGDVIHSLKGKNPAFSVISGDDVFTFPLMALGGDGVMSVISNLVPERMIALVDAALAGDFEKSRAIHYELLPLIKAAFFEVNPVPIKEAMNFVGLPAGGYRLPLCEMSNENRKKLHQVLLAMELTACKK